MSSFVADGWDGGGGTAKHEGVVIRDAAEYRSCGSPPPALIRGDGGTKGGDGSLMLSGEDGRALMLPPPLPPPLTAAPNVDAARGGVGVCSAWRVLPPTAADEKGGGVGVSGWSPAAEDGRDEKRRRLGRHGRLSQVSSSGSGASRGAPGGAAAIISASMSREAAGDGSSEAIGRVTVHE